MKPNALVLALISTATALPGTAHAADDICSRLIIYAITQFCQMLPNGQNLCQPIGLAKPDPTCNSPSADQVVQIPLGPPSLQAWPYAQFPSVPNTFVPNPFVPNPFAANAFTPNALSPNAFAPNAFGPKQLAGNPYLTYLYGQHLNGGLASPAYTTAPSIAAKGTDSVPANAPVAPPVQAPTVVAAIKQEATVEAAPIPVVTQPIDKLMPETKAEAKTEAKQESSPTVAAETAPPPAAEQPVAEVVTTAVAAQPEIPTTQMPPVVEAAPALLPEATIAAAAASPVEADAAKQAEVAQIEAEKARQDALAHFEFDSAELTPAGRAMLDDWLKQASTNDPILVTGHADRLGPEPYNEKLSLLRAEAVKKYLIEQGKPAKRIEIQAKGEKFPLISCTGAPTDATIACLAPNRRAEIVFKPSVRKAARTATKLIKPKSSR
jgi:outer membrane protein OmpA-like peptidoglycan-associated protein